MTENLQQVLESTKSFWQTQWNTIWEWSGKDEFNMAVWGTFIVSTGVYWIIGLLFCPLDLTGKPQSFMKYRIQKNSSYPVTLDIYARAALQAVVNQIAVNLPVLFLYFYLMTWRGNDLRTLPTIQRFLADLIGCILIQEALYFYTHRFLHSPRMFKYHKLHHQWTSPIAITATYCHPVEQVVANLFPIVAGPLVLGCHLSTLWIWMSLAITGTLFFHSGFHTLPFPTTEFHDLHHEKKHHNFGVWGLVDRVYGTDRYH